jgi:hypothetical protein
MCFSDVNYFAKIISGGFSTDRRDDDDGDNHRQHSSASTISTRAKKHCKNAVCSAGNIFATTPRNRDGGRGRCFGGRKIGRVVGRRPTDKTPPKNPICAKLRGFFSR